MAKNMRRRTAEERDAEIAALKTTLDAAIERIATSPEQWVEFLDVVATFAARYSTGNQLLILAQAAERGFSPTMVRPYGHRDRATGTPRSGWAGGWLGLGRQVRKGETALKIFAPVRRRMTAPEYAAHLAAGGAPLPRDPGGRLPERLVGWRTASVFDLSQTEGDPVEPPAPTTVTRRALARGGVRPHLLTGADTTGELDSFIALIVEQGYRFAFLPRAALAGANGATSPELKTVGVREDVEPAQATKTTVHELAHILCGHVADEFNYISHRGQAETEAESVAYIVCGALGLDTEPYSAPYVAHWSEGDMALVRRSADRIITVSRTILAYVTATDTDDDVDETTVVEVVGEPAA